MHFHITITERCNSRCKYCYEKSMNEFGNKLQEKWSFDLSVPVDFEIDVNKLKEFLEQGENPVLIFYGGEPLLKIDKIKEIIDNINCRFCMQTNGKLLDKLPPGYLNKISKVLISIDGDKKRTDYNKGEGTYELVLKNLGLIKKMGIKENLLLEW